jgi:hypothetical protein
MVGVDVCDSPAFRVRAMTGEMAISMQKRMSQGLAA